MRHKQLAGACERTHSRESPVRQNVDHTVELTDRAKDECRCRAAIQLVVGAAFNASNGILSHKQRNTRGPDLRDILADRRHVFKHAVVVPFRTAVSTVTTSNLSIIDPQRTRNSRLLVGLLRTLGKRLDGIDVPADEVERRGHIVRYIDERFDTADAAV